MSRAQRCAGSLAVVVAFTACDRSPRPVTDADTGLHLIAIAAGQFEMGSPDAERERGPGETRHHVSLTRPFFLGERETTQAEWQEVMGVNPSHHEGCPTCPVERVNFGDVARFIAGLNARTHHFRYRLPTEAEWECACRAGTTTAFSTGTNLTTDQANYNGRFPYEGPAGLDRGATMPAESFAPNAWGLFDMHGNVWEWTNDWYGPLAPEAVVDPIGAASGEKRVIRGGSWVFNAASARCAARYTHAPLDLGFSLGMRLAADAR